VRNQLESGRGVVVLDGLDELPERDRGATLRWIDNLTQRYPRSESKLRANTQLNTKQITNGLRFHRARVAEDIHQKRVRAIARVELSPPESFTWKRLIRRCVWLSQSFVPSVIFQNRAITCWQEVAVLRSLFRSHVTDGGCSTMALTAVQPEPACIVPISDTQLTSQCRGVRTPAGDMRGTHSWKRIQRERQITHLTRTTSRCGSAPQIQRRYPAAAPLNKATSYAATCREPPQSTSRRR